MSQGRVLGVDAYRDGWVGIAPDPIRVRAYVGSETAELVARAERDGGSVEHIVDRDAAFVAGGSVMGCRQPISV